MIDAWYKLLDITGEWVWTRSNEISIDVVEDHQPSIVFSQLEPPYHFFHNSIDVTTSSIRIEPALI